MALEFEKLSTHLKEVLLNLKHMSPTQRFNEVSKPRFELQWQTVAFRYGMEKMERQAWMIPDQEILNPTSKSSPLINTDCTDQKQGTDLPQRAQRAQSGAEIGGSEDQTQNPPRRRGDTEKTGESEKQNPKCNTSPLINADYTDQKQGRDLPQRAQRTRRKNQKNTLPLINADHADQEQFVGFTTEGTEDTESGDRGTYKSKANCELKAAVEETSELALLPSNQKIAISAIAEEGTAEPIPQEQLNRLYSGDDRRYVERPEVEEERQRSIEMAARIAAGETQLNGRWQVLRDEEVLQPEVRGEIEERGGVDAIQVNEDFVLARDGRVMYRTQLQHALERELRERMGVPESWETDTKKILWHKEQLARLEKADAAPRCEHIYSDGTRCQAPKLKTGQWCYAHERMKSVRTKKLNLLPTEDANSIMLNLGQIGQALINDEISEKKAGLLMYNQQLGLIALSRVSFKETDGRLMVREAPEVLPQRTRRTQRKNQKKILPRIYGDERGSAKAFTAKGATDATDQQGFTAEGAEERKNKPQICADGGEAGVPSHLANCGRVGNPGFHPTAPTAGASGTQGVECGKSNGFGVEPGGQGIAVITRDRRHRVANLNVTPQP